MHLKSTSLLTLVSILGVTTGANANTLYDIYAGLTLGAGGMTVFSGGHTDNDTAMSYGAVLGMDIPMLRIELEYNYLNDNDINTNLAMLNAYFKMPSTVIHPYFGLGLGTTFGGDIDGYDIKSKPAYQAMLGLTFDTPVLPFDIDLEARVLYAANLVDTGNSTPDLLHYDLRVKLKYVF